MLGHNYDTMYTNILMYTFTAITLMWFKIWVIDHIYTPNTFDINEFNKMTEKAYKAGSQFPPLEAGKLRLYSMRFCPFAERTRHVLAYKEIQYETINVNLKQKPEWFLERNPIGLVPVLEKDGHVIYESLITCDYLDEVYPQNKLNPTDPYQKARDKILVELFSKTFPYNMKYFLSRGEDKEALTTYREKMTPLEKALGERGNFFGGDKPCMVDFIIWPFFGRIPAQEKITNIDQLPKDQFPNLNSWRSRMMEIPSVAEITFDPDIQAQYYRSYSSGTPDYDLGLE